MKILIVFLVIFVFIVIHYTLQTWTWLFNETYNKKKVIHVALPYQCNAAELSEAKYSIRNLPIAKDYHLLFSISSKDSVRVTVLDPDKFVTYPEIKLIEKYLAGRYK